MLVRREDLRRQMSLNESEAVALNYILKTAVQDFGLVPLKEDRLTRQKGARAHMYDMRELAYIIDRFHQLHAEVDSRQLRGRKYRGSTTYHVIQKLREFTHDHNWSIVRLHPNRQYTDGRKLIRIEKVLAKPIQGQWIFDLSDPLAIRVQRNKNNTPVVDHTIVIKGSRITMVGSKGARAVYDFENTAQAKKWAETHLLSKMF